MTTTVTSDQAAAIVRTAASNDPIKGFVGVWRTSDLLAAVATGTGHSLNETMIGGFLNFRGPNGHVSVYVRLTPITDPWE